MNDLDTVYWSARRQAFRAIRRGDLDNAIRWTMVMRHQMRLARSVAALDRPRARPANKPPKPPARAAPPPARKWPVLLDPDGVSPGGQPNWFLNQKRWARAGLNWPPPPEAYGNAKAARAKK